jgi:hypothetical protein
MDRLIVAFDVDDTLIVPAVATGFDRDVPSYETIAVYRWFQAQGHEMVIWSGGGSDYAKMWAEKLGLVADLYLDKHDAHVKPHIAFDDSDLTLAQVNVKVRRVNNRVVRYPDRVGRVG